jgi:hypothetical protein
MSLRFRINAIILQEQLDKLKLDYSLPGFNEVEVNEPISGDRQ